jgi:uncharacterized protein (DUF983 family)
MERSPTSSRPVKVALPPRDAWRAMANGLRRKCPNCGTGALYRAYLKVADTCPSCGEALHHQRTDDAAPWGVMLIVCHVVVGGVLAMEQAWAPSMWVTMGIWAPITVGLSLVLLPIVKGLFVGLQWAFRMHGFGEGPDPADPLPIPVAREQF